MRVLMTRSSAGGYGGAELSAHDNAYCFNKLGHEVIFLSSLKRLRKKVEAAGIETHWVLWPNKHEGPIRILRYLWTTPIFWLQCLYYVFRFKPDVINAHSREDWIAFTLTKWIHRKPVIWRDPADLRHFLEHKSRNILGVYNRQLLLRALKKVDHLYTLNDEEKKLILKRAEGNLDSKRISVIESSVLYDFYDLKAKPPVKTDNLVIGTTSLLREQKGIQYLISAYRDLKKDYPNIELWIVGDGPFMKPLKKLAENLSDVKFWGFQSDISPFLARFDIYVQPAEFEGWGRNVKEAMYFTKPIVGSNVGGIARQITDEENGLLFKPKDEKQLSDQIRLLIDSSELAKSLAEAGREKALADGDYLDVVKDKVLPIYERVV